jgi:hypothetical protein
MPTGSMTHDPRKTSEVIHYYHYYYYYYYSSSPSSSSSLFPFPHPENPRNPPLSTPLLDSSSSSFLTILLLPHSSIR